MIYDVFCFIWLTKKEKKGESNFLNRRASELDSFARNMSQSTSGDESWSPGRLPREVVVLWLGSEKDSGSEQERKQRRALGRGRMRGENEEAKR